MKRFVRRFLLGVLLALPMPAVAAPPQRVVTVNLCLDQLALRIAAPGQLVGVSYLSHDPRISVLADRALDVPSVRATVESILALAPDLVVMDATSHANLKRLLRKAGVRILELPWAASIADAEDRLARLGEAMGRQEAALAVIDTMKAERDALVWRGPPGGYAAVLQANRGTTGEGSLMDELLRLAGLGNLAADLGIPAYGRLSLETVIANAPAFIVLDGAANMNPARATEFVDHHALRTLAGRARVVSLPFKYAICAGPENFEALRLLVEARR